MQCAICSRTGGPKLPCHCVACARQLLYEPRVESATVLLQRDALAHELNRATGDGGDDEDDGNDGGDAPTDASPHKGTTRPANQHTFARDRANVETSEARTREIKAQSAILRQEIEAGKAEMTRLRSTLARRRSDHASATHDLPARRATTLGTVERSIQRTKGRAVQQHQKMAESRVFLCREAAFLYGLRQRRRRKNGAIREDYLIGGVAIVDLRDLNNAPPAQITTSLTHLAHLLVLTSHYLSLQLPAEITLPHRDYPLPTIFTPASSYTSRPVPFPGATPSHSSTHSPSASRTGDLRPLPRPRPLYLEKALPALAKDDPGTYSLFVEGVTLLAWDITWVCRTQGLHVASHSWEEVCPLGRNLWQLLGASARPRIKAGAAPSHVARPSSPSPSPSPTTATSPTRSSLPPGHSLLGHYSHGTAHAFLGAAEGVEHMRGWKLRSPTQIADKVKALLQSEMAGAEWEMLEEREWDEFRPDGATDAAVISTTSGPSNAPLPPADDAPGDDEGRGGTFSDGGGSGGNSTPTGAKGSNTRTGTSGWTKLRPRQ
ncbi:MAG: hypothetical protein M1838_005975 [Thelocarpon superellum]|nr:MAG: hypothetical protein M1838_005975 [Thelocarpon superellum]